MYLLLLFIRKVRIGKTKQIEICRSNELLFLTIIITNNFDTSELSLLNIDFFIKIFGWDAIFVTFDNRVGETKTFFE